MFKHHINILQSPIHDLFTIKTLNIIITQDKIMTYMLTLVEERMYTDYHDTHIWNQIYNEKIPLIYNTLAMINI